MNALPNAVDTLGLAALQLFREGRDTVEIAAVLGLSEARASQLVWLGPLPRTRACRPRC